jgi:hypothetical protein
MAASIMAEKKGDQQFLNEWKDTKSKTQLTKKRYQNSEFLGPWVLGGHLIPARAL